MTWRAPAHCALLTRWHCVQGDKISHIDMGDEGIDTVISHIISLISHIDMGDGHIDMVDNHVHIPYPKSISHIPYRYHYRYLIDVRSPISISHIDLPYRSPDHILSLWTRHTRGWRRTRRRRRRGSSGRRRTATRRGVPARPLTVYTGAKAEAWCLLIHGDASLSLAHCLLIVYRCTRTHSPHPPPRPGRSFPSLFAPGTRVEHDGG